MDTIERESTDTLQGVSVKACDLLDLISGAAIAAHSKSDLQSLNGVRLKVEGGKLIAFATDRYRLIVGELESEGESTLTDSLIPLTDIKRIITALKALDKVDISRELVSITRAGDILTVAIKGSTLLVNIPGGQTPPPYEHLFTGEPEAISELQLNADFLAAFAKVPGGGKAGQRFIFTGDRKPIKVNIPHDTINWRGLLMPMKIV
jgi:DNA polymerase III sliding clamp (beta) subunit (PCNA family)